MKPNGKSAAATDRELLRRLKKHRPRRREVLTEAKVREIRLRHIHNDRTFGASALARKYGVCVATIWKVIQRQTWRHVK